MSPGELDRKMCSSSVEPTPSRMSTPKRASRLCRPLPAAPRPPTCRCAARSRRLVLERLVVQHRREQRRHAVEDRRIVLAHQLEHRRRRRPFGIEHRGRAHRHRKRQRIAETIGEEQFCRRQPDVVLANAEHLFGVGLRGRREIGMQMPHALRHAGRARRIEPERRLVGDGSRRSRMHRSLCAISSDSFM